jgi:uncharacterized protein YeaO (DUF488 family)
MRISGRERSRPYRILSNRSRQCPFGSSGLGAHGTIMKECELEPFEDRLAAFAKKTTPSLTSTTHGFPGRNRTATPGTWRQFEKRYLHELQSPDNLKLLDLLSVLSKQTDFSVGCYCEDESTCHRSILRKVLTARGAYIV